MAAEDEIEKLLREISSQDLPKSAPVQRKESTTPDQQSESTSGGRISFAIAGAAVMGAGGAASGLILPGISMISTGIGAAFGAFLIALVSGPPRWFSR
jgi:anti-sigma factor RsiW